MGLGTKLLVIFICVAFLFSYAPRPCTPADTNSTECYGFGKDKNTNAWTVIMDKISGSTTGGNFYDNVFALFGAAGIALLLTSAIFPNPFLTFAGVAAFLLALASIPYDMLAASGGLGLSASDPFVMFFAATFAILFIIAGLVWYKGNDW